MRESRLRESAAREREREPRARERGRARAREIEGHLRLEKVGTDENLADVFTKVLDRIPFEKFRRLVMNVLLGGVQYLAPRGKRPRSEG